jgi:hypothetical protein
MWSEMSLIIYKSDVLLSYTILFLVIKAFIWVLLYSIIVVLLSLILVLVSIDERSLWVSRSNYYPFPNVSMISLLQYYSECYSFSEFEIIIPIGQQSRIVYKLVRFLFSIILSINNYFLSLSVLYPQINIKIVKSTDMDNW